jgi:hypothetical protein
MVVRSELPLEMGKVEPGEDPRGLKIGVCFRCGRHGLLDKRSGACAGYRAVTAANGIVQMPELRSVRCHILATRKNPADRKLAEEYNYTCYWYYLPNNRMCRCGHPAGEHHRVWWSGGHTSIDECEYWGFNESGGLRYDEVNKQWWPHCQQFKAVPLVIYPDGTITIEGAYECT